jgi:hypothetical protein
MVNALSIYIVLSFFGVLSLTTAPKRDPEDRVVGGGFAIILFVIAAFFVAGESLWAHTFYGSYFWGALFGAALGGIVLTSGIKK